jgi:hypothetical protein
MVGGLERRLRFGGVTQFFTGEHGASGDEQGGQGVTDTGPD